MRQHERFLQSNIPSADLVFYAAARAVPAAAAFFGTIIYARILGAREYALYSMSVNIVMAVSALGFAWLNQGQLRFNSKYEQRRRAAYEGAVSRGSVYASVIVALLAPLGYAVSFSDAHEAGWFLCVIGAATAFYGLHMFNLTRRQAELRPKLYVANEVRRAILSLVVPGMILYVWGCGHRQMLVGLCLALSPAFFEYLHYVRRRFGSDNWGSIGQEMWAFGWPMAMWATLLMSVPFVERFLVLRLIGIDALSRYVPLYDLVYRSFTLFLMPITLAYHPRIMEGYNRNDTLGLRAARRYLVSALLLQLAIGGVVIIPATIWGSAVTEMLRLPGGMHDSWAIATLGMAGMGWQLSHVLHKPIEARGETIVLLRYLLLALIVLVGVDLVFLQRRGIYAAIFANLSAAACYCALCLWRILRMRRTLTSGSPREAETQLADHCLVQK